MVIFDVPGIGGSEPTRLPYRLPWLANFATRVLASVGHDGPVDVAGVSWGGVAAQEFAHLYPDRVRHLMLCATSAGAVMLPASPTILLKLGNPRRYAEPDYLLQIGAEIYGGTIRRNPQLLREYVKDLTPPRGPGYLYQLLAGAGWTSVFWLHALRMPVLVMYGTDDPIMPTINGKFLAAMIPKSRTYTMDDGHLFLLTRAKECAAVIADFVR
jgi:poly(3-hydroxyalkanoate) depolymerase